MTPVATPAVPPSPGSPAPDPTSRRRIRQLPSQNRNFATATGAFGGRKGTRAR